MEDVVSSNYQTCRVFLPCARHPRSHLSLYPLVHLSVGNREGIITDSFPQAGHVQGPVYTAAEEQWLAPIGAQDEAQKEDTGDDTDPDMPELLDGDTSDEEEQVTSEPEVPLRKQWTRSVEPPTPRTEQHIESCTYLSQAGVEFAFLQRVKQSGGGVVTRTSSKLLQRLP